MCQQIILIIYFIYRTINSSLIFCNRVGFALRAVDEAGNVADISNVAMLDFFMIPPKSLLSKCNFVIYKTFLN